MISEAWLTWLLAKLRTGTRTHITVSVPAPKEERAALVGG